MSILFKKVDYNLQSLIHQIDMGTIGLPDIQRPFVWKDTKVRDLFDSMYKGYPVGYFLFWENGLSNSSRSIGTNGKQKTPDLLIVDGQQRLTSLYAVTRAKEIILRKKTLLYRLNLLMRNLKYPMLLHAEAQSIFKIFQKFLLPMLIYLL